MRALKEEGQKQYYRLHRWRFSLLNQDNVELDPARRPEHLGLVSPSQQANYFIYRKDYEMSSLLEPRFFQAPAAHRRIGSAHRLNGAGPSKALLGLGASMKKGSTANVVATATKAAGAKERDQALNSQLLSRQLSSDRIDTEQPESTTNKNKPMTEKRGEDVRYHTELAQSNEELSGSRSHVSTPQTATDGGKSVKRSSKDHYQLGPDRIKMTSSALVGAPGRSNMIMKGPNPAKGMNATFEPIMVPSFGQVSHNMNNHAQSSFIRHA